MTSSPPPVPDLPRPATGVPAARPATSSRASPPRASTTSTTTPAPQTDSPQPGSAAATPPHKSALRSQPAPAEELQVPHQNGMTAGATNGVSAHAVDEEHAGQQAAGGAVAVAAGVA